MKKLIVVLVMLMALNARAQWQPDVRLTNDPASSYTSDNNAWCVGANGNIVHTVWYDTRTVNGGIYYKRSTDGGINWGADILLTNNTTPSFSPSIAVSGSNVHIVYETNLSGNREIFYKHSTDGGINWGMDTRLTNNTAWSESPSVAVSGYNVHIVWYEWGSGNKEIYYKRSTDSGITWVTDTRLTNSTFDLFLPSIAVSGPNVHIVWSDLREGNYEIFYKRSTDSGITWGTDTRLTNNSSNSTVPSIAVSGSNVHIVWIDGRDLNSEIYYKRSTDSGINWGSDTRLTNNSSSSSAPSIAVSGSNVHFVWNDYRDGNSEIYYKRSADNGMNWGSDTRLTNNFSTSESSSIAVSGSIVHVLWEDFQDDNDEIYYKRNPTGNVGIQNISTEVPSMYSLKQNYPNPFNPTTKIRFDIPRWRGEGGWTSTLRVYDIMGREVQTLVNERLQPGTYEVSFDGSQLTSGIYFYKISIGDFSVTKKMTLIK